ncbi:hypothetical protein [Acetanaerobacterium elongatum]|uniref:Antitoxin Phd_YefM, type II toxin-antitoxin system n=1 Tax=Acetanaerobacterium elongatum TaxID=258515 RepID=A0A1H0EZC6_9FIRM|nr:hypothetical protein [Acetanaerobacterium elongatum]SDN87659.1 hypothetical protein SAMN05192585_1374 [Acetanaerobacterium elongatum]
MKEVSLDQFKAGTDEIVREILSAGDIYCVDVGKSEKIVIMEEAEYKIMREALGMVITLASKDNTQK